MSKSVYLKIAKAQEAIKKTTVKKAGYNDFSKFNYFTPEQISQVVNEACKPLELLNKFDLVRNELGIQGELKVIDLGTGEHVVFTMASDIPSIKATNIAQQLGGASTYTKRYLLMGAYDITDNNLDFDGQRPAAPAPKAEPKPKPQAKQQAPPANNNRPITPSKRVIDQLFTLAKQGHYDRVDKNIVYWTTEHRTMKPGDLERINKFLQKVRPTN